MSSSIHPLGLPQNPQGPHVPAAALGLLGCGGAWGARPGASPLPGHGPWFPARGTGRGHCVFWMGGHFFSSFLRVWAQLLSPRSG